MTDLPRKKKDDEEEFSLKQATFLVGQLYPVLKDKYGKETIDGFHRLKEDPSWKFTTVDSVDTPVKLAVARLVANERRGVPAKEKSKRIGEIYEEFKRARGEYPKPSEVATWLGWGKRTFYRYLPPRYKEEEPAELARARLSRQKEDANKFTTPEELLAEIVQLKGEGLPYRHLFSHPLWPALPIRVMNLVEKGKSQEEVLEALKTPPVIAPQASQFARKADTPSHMALVEELSRRGVLFKTEVPIKREGTTEDGKPKTYIVDVLVGDRLAVEVDGKGHDFASDEKRDAFLKEKGFSVLHFKNETIRANPEAAADSVEFRMGEKMDPETITDALRDGIKKGFFTMDTIMAKMGAFTTLQLAKAFRANLTPGTRCPVCESEVPT